MFWTFDFFITFAVLFYAKVAQLVERNLAKVEVASSNLVFRSTVWVPSPCREGLFLDTIPSARVVELVDTQDLKSCVSKVVELSKNYVL